MTTMRKFSMAEEGGRWRVQRTFSQNRTKAAQRRKKATAAAAKIRSSMVWLGFGPNDTIGGPGRIVKDWG